MVEKHLRGTKIKKLLSIVLALAMVITLMPAMNLVAYAADGVIYRSPIYTDSSDVTQGVAEWEILTCTEYTEVTSEDTDWNDGWYVVSGDVTISGSVSVNGTVNLILADDSKLTVGRIVVKSGTIYNSDIDADVPLVRTLNIYGQTAGTGELISSGGIGSDEKWYTGSNITINGGVVTVTGGDYVPGIGGGKDAAASNITINGGTVTATGGYDAAGIGSGYGATASDITINGGIVTATGGYGGAAIGGGLKGEGSNITITGGTVTATGGKMAAGIGGGQSANGSNITITGGNVTATGGYHQYEDGTVYQGAGIGGGQSGEGVNITFSGVIVKAGDTENPTQIVTSLNKERFVTTTSCGVVHETMDGKHDGQITELSADYEYSTDGGTTWTACTGDKITGLTPGTVKVKVKGTEATESNVIDLVIKAGPKAVLSLPEGATYSMTCDPAAGAAYGESATLTFVAQDGYVITEPLKVTVGGVERTFTKNASGKYTCTIESITSLKGLKVTSVSGYDKDPDSSEDPSSKTITKDVQVAEDAPVESASLDNSSTELMNSTKLFTTEEKAAIANGESAKVYLKIGSIDKTDIATADQTKIETAAEKVLGENITIEYIDIALFKQVGAATAETVHDPGIDIKVTIEIPSSMLVKEAGVVRKYRIVRLHDEEAVAISGTFNSATNEFTFSTDKFSTYAIVYSDEKMAIEISTPNNSKTISKIGGTLQLSSIVTPVEDASQTVTYKSSKESVATVDANGLVTAVANGTTTITVTTEDGSVSNTIDITVSAAEAESTSTSSVPKTGDTNDVWFWMLLMIAGLGSLGLAMLRRKKEA